MRSRKVIAFPATVAPDKKQNRTRRASRAPRLERAAVFSFLKDTRGLINWTGADLAKTLRVTQAQANEALPILAMQSYILPSDDGSWITTIAGEQISDSETPRYRKQAVEDALAALKRRIQAANKRADTGFTVTRAVAFGDFLSDASRVQPADVGIELKQRAKKSGDINGHAAKQIFAVLRAKSPTIRLRNYEAWMSTRTHEQLI